MDWNNTKPIAIPPSKITHPPNSILSGIISKNNKPIIRPAHNE